LADIASALPPLDPGLDGLVNMTHMELLLNFSLEIHIPDMGGVLKHSGTKLILKCGIEAPYLMHEVLAMSARHLSVVDPSRREFAAHLAVQLQTRAVSMFNTSKMAVNKSNCISMVLFSSLLGRHLFTDLLARRDAHLGTFLDNYTICVRLHEGIRAITSLSWPYLLESDLAPFLAWGASLSTATLRGHECDGVREMITNAQNLYEADKKVCLSAIRFLQIGLDAIAVEDNEGHGCRMIFTWSIIVAHQFNTLIAQRRPEALVILAYFTLLLHRGRTMWQCQDAGRYIFGLIAQFLGTEWDAWLALPREQILAG
jgi:hypothetical protein